MPFLSTYINKYIINKYYDKNIIKTQYFMPIFFWFIEIKCQNGPI